MAIPITECTSILSDTYIAMLSYSILLCIVLYCLLVNMCPVLPRNVYTDIPNTSTLVATCVLAGNNCYAWLDDYHL